MPHDKNTLPHTISSAIRHQETGLIAAGVPPSDASIIAHETFCPTEIEHPVSQEDSENQPPVYIQIPWVVEPEIEPVRTRKLVIPADPLAGLESLFQHTGDITSLWYRRPGKKQTSLSPMEVDRAVSQWEAYVVPIITPGAEPNSTPVPPSLIKVMEDLHAAGITQEMLEQTSTKYMVFCGQHSIAPGLFSRVVPDIQRWHLCEPLDAKKKPYEWMLRESRVYRATMKILQAAGVLESREPSIALVARPGMGLADLNSEVPADWEDIRDQDLNGLGFERTETTQIEFDENEQETYDVLERLRYWETLRGLEQLFKHTGDLDNYYRLGDTPLYLPNRSWADPTWEEIVLPIIGSIPWSPQPRMKLERLRSLAEAGISKEMLQETRDNYLPLCNRFAISPWYFERDIPNVARLRQLQPEVTEGNYVWILNESRVYKLMMRLLVQGTSDLISVNTGTSLAFKYDRALWSPTGVVRQKALNHHELWHFKCVNTPILNDLTLRIWLSIEYLTMYHFEARVVKKPPGLSSSVGQSKTEILGSSDIYWHKMRSMDDLRAWLPDLITSFAFGRLDAYSRPGHVQLMFFIKETDISGVNLEDDLTRDRYQQLTDRRVQSLPPLKAPASLEELEFEHCADPEWAEDEMYTIPDEAWEYPQEQDWFTPPPFFFCCLTEQITFYPGVVRYMCSPTQELSHKVWHQL